MQTMVEMEGCLSCRRLIRVLNSEIHRPGVVHPSRFVSVLQMPAKYLPQLGLLVQLCRSSAMMSEGT